MRRSTKLMLMQDAQKRGMDQERYDSEYTNRNDGRRMIGYDRNTDTQHGERRRDDWGRYMDGGDSDGYRMEYDQDGYGSERYARYPQPYLPPEMHRTYPDTYPGMPMMNAGSRTLTGSGMFRMIYPPSSYEDRRDRMGHEREGLIHESGPLDEHTARMWVRQMRNADGTSGGHYKFDQTEQHRETLCPRCSEWDWYAAMNMMYSDYCETAKQLGCDKPDFYAKMAKAFLEDEDAGKHKMRKYMEAMTG